MSEGLPPNCTAARGYHTGPTHVSPTVLQRSPRFLRPLHHCVASNKGTSKVPWSHTTTHTISCRIWHRGHDTPGTPTVAQCLPIYTTHTQRNGDWPTTRPTERRSPTTPITTERVVTPSHLYTTIQCPRIPLHFPT